MRNASSASTTRAVNSSSFAIGQPICAPSDQVLLIRPYAAARKRNLVSSQPMRMSSDEDSTAAPPKARPFIMPIVGLALAEMS